MSLKARIHSFARGRTIYLILTLAFVVASVASKDFRSVQNIINLFSRSSIVGILAIGQTMVLLTGGFDLAQGSYVALVSVLMAISLPLGLASAIAITLAGVVFLGLVSGFFVNRGITPFIVTLTMMGVARTLALWLSGINVINVDSPALKQLFYGNFLGVPLCVYLWLLLSMAFSFFLNQTRTGRHLYAVGGNRESARLSGVNVKAVMLMVFVLSAFCSVMAGLIYTARLGVALPDSAEGYEMDAIASAIIGGTSLFGGVGSLGGTFAGVLIYGIITNLLTIMGVSTYMQQVVKGVIILLAVFMNTRTGLKAGKGQSA